MKNYFSDYEFFNLHPGCSMSSMDQEFLRKLNLARELADIPFKLNSAFRSVHWEKMQGRDGNSTHTEGKAVDIHCINSSDRFKIVQGLILAGFNRIGISKDFVHVDSSVLKDTRVIWLY
jgi:uncharacterized protein YcbK (DUF882 family)